MSDDASGAAAPPPDPFDVPQVDDDTADAIARAIGVSRRSGPEGVTDGTDAGDGVDASDAGPSANLPARMDDLVYVSAVRERPSADDWLDPPPPPREWTAGPEAIWSPVDALHAPADDAARATSSPDGSEPAPGAAVNGRTSPSPSRIPAGTASRAGRGAPVAAPSGRGLIVALLSLLRQRRRIALSVVAVALGVGYLAGSLSLLQRVSQGLSDLAGTGTERSDLVLEGQVFYSSPLEEVPTLISDSAARSILHVEGVAAVQPRIEDSALLLHGDRPVVPLGLTEHPEGANWPEVASLNPYKLAAGMAPSTADQVVIDTTSARAGGFAVGDRISIVTKTVARQFTISGITRVGDKDLPPGSSLALFATPTARDLFGRANDDNSIGVLATPGTDLDQLATRLRAVVPPGIEVVDRATFEHDRQQSLAKSFTLIKALILGFAALALVVGGFTVANSNALLFARRRRSFALLRLVGARPRLLTTAAMGEAAIVGIGASIVGIPLGLGIGKAIEAAIGALGSAVPVAGPIMSPSVIGASVTIGLVITMATAVAPAMAASRTPPIAAVIGSEGLDDLGAAEGGGTLRRIATWTGTGAAVGLLAGWLAGQSAVVTVIAGGAGAVVMLIGAVLPGALSGLVGRLTVRLVDQDSGMRSLVALRSRHARTRAAGTTAALLLATAVVASLSVLSSSFVASLSGQVDHAVTADLVVDSMTFTRGGLPSALFDNLRTAAGVTAVSGYRVGRASVGRSDVRISAMNGASMFQLVNLDVEGTPPRHLDPAGIAVSAGLARTEGLHVGDRVELGFQGRLQLVTVQAIYRAATTLVGEAVIDTDLLARATPSSIDILALVNVDHRDAAAATERVKRIAATYGVTSVGPPSQLVSQRAQLLTNFERVIQWMLLFSVLLAVIGVANTLQLSVNERRRELGLLRSIGASRAQVVRLVLVEAVALSAVGSVIGMVVGVGGAFAAVRALASLGLSSFSAPVLALALALVAAMGLGIAGAALPAWQASRTGIMEALGEDETAEAPTGRFAARFGRGRPGSPVAAPTARPAPSRTTGPAPFATSASATVPAPRPPRPPRPQLRPSRPCSPSRPGRR